MTINLGVPAMTELKPRISVVGVGGAGGNAVNNMITASLDGVEFVVANTDAQALSQSLTECRIQMGINVTQGLGAGSNPAVGYQAAEESMSEILDAIAGTHMVFITAGMGGGTGTGAAPVIARAAREAGILTVGVATKPFQFEGGHRMAIAEAGIEEFEAHVDTLIIIPNQNLFRVANEKTTFAEAFKMADDVLYSGVRGVTDLMVMPGLINLDFADVRTVMMEMGKAMMGTGEAEGEKRALEAAEAAISSPLLDEVSMKGARSVLINITGGPDMTLYEVDEVANRIREEIDSNANIIFGSIFDESIEGRMRVSVVATGIDAEQRIVSPHVHTLYPEPGRVADLADAPPIEMAQPAFALGSQAAPPVSPIVAGGGGAASAALRADPVMAEPALAEPVQAQTGLATPAAETRPAEAPFIAPRPAQPAARRAPLGSPEPFAEAALANARHEPAAKPSCGPSLLDRVRGRNRPGKTPVVPTVSTRTAAPAAAEETAPRVSAAVETTAPPAPESADEPHSGAALSKSPAAPEAASRPAAAAPAKAADATADATAVSERLAPEPEEDLLEIPAFLRRQAN